MQNPAAAVTSETEPKAAIAALVRPAIKMREGQHNRQLAILILPSSYT